MAASAVKKKLVNQRHRDAGGGSQVDFNEEAIKRARRVVEKNAALSKVYDSLRALVAETTREEASRRYKIGELVRQVRDDEHKYGRRSVEALAMLLRFDKSTLHDYATVAETWSARDFNALLKRRNGLGLGLRFSHLVVLTRVANSRKRDALAARALEQNLTVRQLEQIVRVGGAADGDMATTKPTVKTPADAIRQVAARWEAAVDELERDTRELVQLASSQRSPELLAMVRTAAERQRALAQKAAECADELAALAEKAPS